MAIHGVHNSGPWQHGGSWRKCPASQALGPLLSHPGLMFSGMDTIVSFVMEFLERVLTWKSRSRSIRVFAAAALVLSVALWPQIWTDLYQQRFQPIIDSLVNSISQGPPHSGLENIAVATCGRSASER